MNGFHHVTLPDAVALSVRRAQQFATEIIGNGGGAEIRNARQKFARRHYVLETGVISRAQGQVLSQFFDARRGRQYGFLLRDWMDFHTGHDAPAANDERVRAIDSQPGVFELLKSYSAAGGFEPRRIFKPMTEGFLLTLKDRLLVAGTDYTINPQNGTVTLKRPGVLAADIRVGFYHHIPVRFDSDRLEMERLEGDMVRMQPMPLVELVAPYA